MDDDFDIDVKLFISQIEQHPILWDKTLELYKNRVATREAWIDIMNFFKPDSERMSRKAKQHCVLQLIQKWTHIRDNYYRSLKKIEYQRRCGVRRSKPYVYSKKLNFLHKIIDPKYNDILQMLNEDVDIRRLMGTIGVKEGKANVDNEKKTVCVPEREPEITNRHLAFFHSLLPTLDNFDDDDTLEFQEGVLQLVRSIKKRQYPEFSSFKHDFSGSYVRNYF